MKQKVLFIAVLFMALVTSQNVLAYDFSAVAPSGQTLYYRIVNGEAHVCPPSASWGSGVSGDLIIPSSVTYNNHTYLVTVLETINNTGPFSGCSGLTSVIIPNTVISIGEYAFHNCSNMTSISIGTGVYNLSRKAFNGCTNLTSVTYNAVNCTMINDASTDYPLFYQSPNITTITIGDSVTNIPAFFFHGCSNLIEIHSNASIAPTCGGFTGVPNTIPIYIPCGSSMSYYSRWSYFSNFVEEPGFTFNAISSDSTMGNVTILTQPTCQNHTAVFNAIANNGYNFSNWSDGNTDNPRSLVVTQDTLITAYFALVSNDTIHDTTYISVHDTTILHDTVYLPYYVHDTTTLYDTFYVNVHDTIIAYVNVPVHDTIIAYINVPVHDTVYLPQYIYDTLWLHDTIIIHDTVYITQEGVDNVDVLNAKVYSNNGQIVVDGAEGNTVWLYDATGRILVTKQDYGTPLRFDILASGTYMIKIGNYPTRKVVVIK